MTEPNSSSGESSDGGDEEAHMYIDPSSLNRPFEQVDHEHIRQVVDNVFRNIENRDPHQNRFRGANIFFR